MAYGFVFLGLVLPYIALFAAYGLSTARQGHPVTMDQQRFDPDMLLVILILVILIMAIPARLIFDLR